MRTLSQASLNKISSQDNVEPFLVVEVYWNNGANTRKYCDRKFSTEEVQGNLINISGIEDIVDISNNANSVSLQVTLDDTDGETKAIFDNVDIHKTYVKVYQWFTDIPFSDAFVLFEGQINTPITWDEGSRTLAFDVVSQVEDIETGFSIEEGKLDFMPFELVGQAWPTVFGTVSGLKPLKMLEAPHGILQSGFGIVDHNLWEAELDEYGKKIAELTRLARDAFLAGQGEAIIASRYKGFLSTLADDPSQANQHDAAATSYFKQSADYTDEKNRMQLEYSAKLEEFNLQKSFEYRVIPIVNSNIPQGVSLQFTCGSEYVLTGMVVAGALVITDVTVVENPNKQTTYESKDTTTSPVSSAVQKANSVGNKFTWIDGGTEIRAMNFPIKYIASLGHATVLNVWARSQGLRVIVPPNYYVVERTAYNTLPVTLVTFLRPLTSYLDVKYDSDEIELDVTGPVGTNIVDIMRYIIELYCKGVGIDETSFSHVRSLVDPFPANFALTERKNVVQLLQEIAYQARCSIFINDRKFHLVYLPEDRAPVDGINDGSIEVNSVKISCTPTERLITKYIAEWKRNLWQTNPYQFIFRYNIQKYGTQESSVNFYIYNNAELVRKAALFWMIRSSISWKILTCRTVLSKLRLETFDPITVDFTDKLVCNEPVTGIIQRATYLPDEHCIEMEIWLPVRMGEMVRYNFAYPGTISDNWPVPEDPNVSTGNPYEEARGELYNPNYSPWGFQSFNGTNTYTSGGGVPISDAGNTAPPPVVTALSPGTVSGFRPLQLGAFNNQKQYELKEFEQATFTKFTPNIFYGEIISKVNEAEYSVRVYLKGFEGQTETIRCFIGKIKVGEQLPPGYPVAVYRTTFVDSTGSTAFEYWFQPTLWVPGVEQEETNSTVPDDEEDTGDPGEDTADNGDDGLGDTTDETTDEADTSEDGSGNDGADDGNADGFPSDLSPSDNADPPDFEPGDSGVDDFSGGDIESSDFSGEE